MISLIDNSNFIGSDLSNGLLDTFFAKTQNQDPLKALDEIVENISMCVFMSEILLRRSY